VAVRWLAEQMTLRYLMASHSGAVSLEVNDP
jgi:hypothetical protein